MSSANDSKIIVAKKYTDRIFLNSEINKYRYKNIEYLWGCYSELYKNFSLKKASNLNLKNSNNLSRIFLKYLPIYVIAIIYSVISYIILFVTSFFKKHIAIWTGDFYNFELKSDFRLGRLYKEFDSNKISYIEFIRLGEISYKSFFTNLFYRRRLVIYYDSFDIFLYFLTPSINIKICDNYFNNIELKIINSYINNFSKKRYQIYLFNFLFKSLGIKKYISWETSHRQLFSRIAASDCQVSTIGFMHGFGFNSYLSYLHLDGYNGNYKFGPDVFIVWSEFWKTYFLKSNIYREIYDWGPLRFNTFSNTKGNKVDKRINILYITEPLIDVSEMLEYLFFLTSNKSKYNVTFKLRNLNCKFYNKLIKDYPEFKIISVTTELFEKAVNKFDLVIGSHSTAVLESSIFSVPFLAVITSKWGDYFEISKKFPYSVVNSIDDFKLKINSINNLDNEVFEYFSKNYYGTNNSINKIIELLK